MPVTEQNPQTYVSDAVAPADFDDFWSDTIAAARAYPLDPQFRPQWTRHVVVQDVTFSGYAGQRVKAWLATPAGATSPLPCVVEFPGYGGGRGLPHQCLVYAAAGYAHLFMDVRGQGSGWRTGDTPDPQAAGDPQVPGFMTRGVLDPSTYYYRRVVTDAVRAVEAARSHPLVDPASVVVTGESQGAGLALAAAALAPDIAGVCADVPFLCDMRRGVLLASAGPYPELATYLSVHSGHEEQVFRTLSYFDGLHFAARSTCPALFSVAWMDASCPPSTAYAVHRAYAGPKQLVEYRFNTHLGGGAVQDGVRLRFLDALFA